MNGQISLAGIQLSGSAAYGTTSTFRESGGHSNILDDRYTVLFESLQCFGHVRNAGPQVTKPQIWRLVTALIVAFWLLLRAVNMK